MAGKIREFPSQLQTGWDIGSRLAFSRDLKSFRHIIFAGMGGSAIAGDLIYALSRNQNPIPFIVNRGYGLPYWAGPETLFIASSYSGNTEETLSATTQAVQKNCTLVCITSGGKLAEIADEKKCPLFVLPKGYPPRGALGFSLGVLLNLFGKMVFGSTDGEKMLEAIRFCGSFGQRWGDPKHPDNFPFASAERLAGKIPILYTGADLTEPVGFRWKTQFNENSKTHAYCSPLPEMNHNEIISWKNMDGTRTFYPHLAAVLLRTAEEHPRTAMRMEISKELILKNGGACLEISAEGGTSLERMLYLIHYGDWVSLYLALLYGADPTEIDNINYLKNKLGAVS